MTGVLSPSRYFAYLPLHVAYNKTLLLVGLTTTTINRFALQILIVDDTSSYAA